MPLSDSPPPLSAKQLAAQARCAAMVAHARAQIMAVGVDRFSVNEVLRRAGGSKATLAKYFGDRNGLIAAAIREEALGAMAALNLDSDESRAEPLDGALARALAGVLRFYLSAGSLALYRAVISAAPSGAGGAEAFYAHGHRVIVDAIAGLLAARQPLQVRAELDCADAADQLLHAIRAGLYERALLGMAEAAGDDAIDARIAATLALVLPGIAPPPNA
ncbi:TetR/AcrR family transcriptional regulator [Novosphingobium sp. ERN07]|uniref:TetR/AcrR family transcriptional regulator C-terminal domain-containing protein n=1 Tax=Novosphingobium sp. ERN07 TaxID=2726187 RepID=UPI0014571B00|nr:TetR/AcrR family transcriptional regulator C-terminal domain-containing protein [Novosphingobium sp. ERN07]NLR71942.1 TetR/AcrR family transcriptional regulator [Novosphingobium sp. ERN07]